MMRSTLYTLLAFSLLSACGTSPVSSASDPVTSQQSQQVVDYNYTLQHALDIYACAHGKENEAEAKKKLQLGLYLTRLYDGDEARYKREVDPTRPARHKQLNEIALKYNCAPTAPNE